MLELEKINEIRHKAILDSKQTRNVIFAFSDGKTFIVYNPLSAKTCIEEQNKAGAVLIGRFREGKEI